MDRVHLIALRSAPVIFLLLSACGAIPVKTQEIHSNLPRDLSPQVSDTDLAALVRGNDDFAFALYHQIAGGDENLIFSPYSISIALAMTYAGATGDTADQMAQALSFTLPGERLHPAFNQLALELASRSTAEGMKPDQAFQLNIANSLWGQSGFHFEQTFLDTLALNYAAGMRLVDYEKDPDAAGRTINDWISQSTNQKIKDLIPKGGLDRLTSLVLADAIYFRAVWQKLFEVDATRTGPFHLLDGDSVDVPLMQEQESLASMQGDGYSAVELPYAGAQLSMLVLLPDEGRFRDIESRLDAGLLNATVAAMKFGDVPVTIPKFKFEWSPDNLPGIFRNLGMTDVFDPNQADFSGMDGKRDLYISDILHKAFVSVDESGTEAAASTVVIVRTSVSIPPSPEFKADHPFFFFIRDIPTGAILFEGQVTNPAAS